MKTLNRELLLCRKCKATGKIKDTICMYCHGTGLTPPNTNDIEVKD